MLVDRQADGLTNAIGTVVAYDTGKNAAVGFSNTLRFGERNGTRLLGIVTNHQDVVFTYFWYMIGDSTVSKR